MYILALNEHGYVISSENYEGERALVSGEVEVYVSTYVRLAQNPSTPYMYSAEGGLVIDTPPTSYHSWVDHAWVVSSESLAAIKESIWEDGIKSLRDDKLANGGYPTAYGWFHSDDSAQLNYEDLYKVKGILAYAPPKYWKKMDGTFVAITEAIVDAIFSSKITQKSDIFAYAEYHKSLMLASSDPLSYDFSGGWPTVYGE